MLAVPVFEKRLSMIVQGPPAAVASKVILRTSVPCGRPELRRYVGPLGGAYPVFT